MINHVFNGYANNGYTPVTDVYTRFTDVNTTVTNVYYGFSRIRQLQSFTSPNCHALCFIRSLELIHFQLTERKVLLQ